MYVVKKDVFWFVYLWKKFYKIKMTCWNVRTDPLPCIFDCGFLKFFIVFCWEKSVPFPRVVLVFVSTNPEFCTDEIFFARGFCTSNFFIFLLCRISTRKNFLRDFNSFPSYWWFVNFHLRIMMNPHLCHQFLGIPIQILVVSTVLP